MSPTFLQVCVSVPVLGKRAYALTSPGKQRNTGGGGGMDMEGCHLISSLVFR